VSGRADIIELAQVLGLSSVDPVLLDRYYTEALIKFGQETEILLEPTFFAVTQGVATYEVFDTNAVAGVFFGTRELTKTTLEHLTTYDILYRTREGTPRVWCEEHENHNVIRLYPVPDADSVAANIFPDPMGLNYPADQLVVFASNRDETAAPWLDFVLATSILARNLVIQSSYRDDAIAAAASALGGIARGLGSAP
jgi:hypothetical protein